MSYSTENRKLSDIFSRSARYVVPRYQRDYVWDKTNWREFYNDISFTLVNQNAIKWSHFLGTVVLSRVPTGSAIPGVDDYEIIDGQQRLTTAFILTCAVYRRLLEIGSDDSRNRSKYVYDLFLTSLDKRNERTPKLSNPDHEEEVFDLLQSCGELGQPDERNVFSPAFSYFQAQLKDKDLSELDGFLNKMMDATVVEIVSTDDEEIYNIFEVLNARGKQLKQIELLKNHVLKYLQPRTGDFVDKAKRDWEWIVESVSHDSDPDDFINHFAKSYLAKNAPNAKEVYRLIKDEVPINNLRGFLDSLKEFASCYKTMLEDESPEVTYFKIKRNKQIRPLVASVMLKQNQGVIDETTSKKALTQLRNFFFTFNALDLTSNRTDRPVTQAAYGVYHAQTATEFRVVISELFWRLESYIDLQAFPGHLLTNNSLHYSNKSKTLTKNSKLVRYVLGAYCNSFQCDLPVDPDSLTIEHLMPDDGMSQTTALANLTLTSASINQKQLGTRDVGDKVRILADKSNLEVNRNLKKFVLADGTLDISARNEEMSKALVERVFPFDPACFGLDRSQVEKYRQIEKLIVQDEELLGLLRESGLNLETRLANDSSLLDAKEKYESLLGRTIE